MKAKSIFQYLLLKNKYFSIIFLMWLFIFWPFNIIGCITLIVGSFKFGSYLSVNYFDNAEFIIFISSALGLFLAYRLSKYTHIWGEAHKLDIDNLDPVSKILDLLGLSVFVPFLFIYLVIWVLS